MRNLVTDLPAFRRWFKNSPLVDRNGAPLVLYHGTCQDFDAFDLNSIGSNFAADDRGFFFTSSPQEASDYAVNDTVGLGQRAGSHVIPVYVSLQCPLIVDVDFLRDEGMGGLLGPDGKEDTISFWDVYQGLILEWADEKQADGIIIVDPAFTEANGEDRRLVVAFSPVQIKSALGNSGAFNPRSADLCDRPKKRVLENRREDATAKAGLIL